MPARREALPLPHSIKFLIGLMIFLLVAGVLSIAKAILIPIALAILITFLLTPVVMRIQRMGVPRVISVLIVVAISMAAIGGVSWLIASQVYGVAQELTKHEAQIKANVSRLTEWIVGSEEQENAEQVDSKKDLGSLVSEVQAEFEETSDTPQPFWGLGPIPVQLTEPEVVPDTYTMIAVNAAGPLGTAGLVFVLALFMLFKREDLRNRIVTLSGRTNLAVTTQALDEAGRRIARYLLMQFIINVSYGICVAVGLSLIGLEYAALWGICATILRYIPYIGPWIAASLPVGYSLLTSLHWTEPIYVIVLIVVLELLSNNLMEPWLYGRGVGLSSVAVILGAVFWGWLWGPVGLVLATPLTACLVVAGRYVPALALFNRFLGDVPEVEPHFVYYQRLLARDEDEAQEIFDELAEEKSLAEACEEILVPTLYSLKNDRARGIVSHDQTTFILEAIEEHLEEVPVENAEITDEAAAKGTPLFLAYGSRDPEDEAAAMIVARLVARDPYQFVILSDDMLSSEVLERIRNDQPAAFCLFSMPPGGLTQTRRLCKRLHAAFPDLKIILGRWGRGLREKQKASFRELGVAYIGRTPAEIREQIHSVGRLNPGDGATRGADADSDRQAQSATS